MSENNQLWDTDDIIVEQIPSLATSSSRHRQGDRLFPISDGTLWCYIGRIGALAHKGTKPEAANQKA